MPSRTAADCPSWPRSRLRWQIWELELHAADERELRLVEATLLPVLLEAAGTPELAPYARALLGLRDARTGWTLMHLAAGTGLLGMVEALLALEGRGPYTVHTKSYCGDSVRSPRRRNPPPPACLSLAATCCPPPFGAQPLG